MKTEKKLLIALIVIQVILLSIPIINFFKPRFYQEFKGNELSLNCGRYEEENAYIDENNYFSGYFAVSNGITLKKGVYDVVIYYRTDTEHSEFSPGNYIEFFAADSGNGHLRYDKCALKPDSERAELTVWTDKKLEDFKIATVFVGRDSLSISRILIAQSYKSFTYEFFKCLLISIIIDIIIVLAFKLRRRELDNGTIFTGLALMGMMIFSSYMCSLDYMIKGHDLTFHLARIEGIVAGLKNGDFPVKIYPQLFNGYGYAAPVYYGDLLLYIPAVFRMIGCPIQEAYNLYIILVNIATVLVSYYCFKGIFKDKGCALFGTAVYSMCLYRMVNIYVRSAVGEYSAMIFLPLLVYGMYRVFTEDIEKKTYDNVMYPIIIGLTGILQCHVLSFAIACGMLALASIIMIRRVLCAKRFWMLIKTVVYTIGVNMFFLVPMLSYSLLDMCNIDNGEMATTQLGPVALSNSNFFSILPDTTGYLHVLSQVHYEYGAFKEADIGPGIALILVLAGMVALIILGQKGRFMKLAYVSTAMGALALWMAYQCFPWEIAERVIKGINIIQFPWRMLGIASILLSVTAMCEYMTVKEEMNKKNLLYGGVIALVATTLIVSGYGLEKIVSENKPYRVYSDDMLDYNLQEIEYTGYGFEDYILEGDRARAEHRDEAVQVDTINKGALSVEIKVANNTSKRQRIFIPLFYFEGYKIATDSSNGDISIKGSKYGTAGVVVPEHFEGNIKVWFEQPAIWRIAQAVSLFVVTFIVILWYNKKDYTKIRRRIANEQ